MKIQHLALQGLVIWGGFVASMQPIQAQPAAPTPSPLETLEVQLSKVAYEGGEPVYLDITLQNKGNRPASFLMLGPRLEFKLRREGKQVGLTYKAKDESKGDKISVRTVPTGGKFSYRLVLNRLFDLSRSGNYTLNCTKFLRNDPLDPNIELVGPQIVAQTLKFSVAEADCQPVLQSPQQPAKPAQ